VDGEGEERAIVVAHRAQADALEIEATAKRRLAYEYDAAQQRSPLCRGRVKSIQAAPTRGPPTRTMRVFLQQSGGAFGWKLRIDVLPSRLFPRGAGHRYLWRKGWPFEFVRHCPELSTNTNNFSGWLI
jgi:hypothetical protein